MTHGTQNLKIPSAYVSPSMSATKFHTHTKQRKFHIIQKRNRYVKKLHIYCTFVPVGPRHFGVPKQTAAVLTSKEGAADALFPAAS
jgi:hypothetical protein